MAKIHKKQTIEDDVHSLAIRRLRLIYERFDKVVVSFSGGKDSTACVHLALEAAREAGRLPLDVYTFDEEAIPPETVEYMTRLAANPDIRFKWFCLPIQHRNACSRKEPYWYCWDQEKRNKWVRELPPLAITELKGFKRGDAIPECTPLIWGAENGTVANVMGIRCQESMTRYQSVATKVGFECFTIPFAGAKWISQVYPIYDWATEDVWRAPAAFGWDYNRAYDRMEAAGVTRQDARCSPPYGEQPIRRLWSYKQCWPELWAKMTERVHGAATAARYANTELYGIGVKDSDLPDGLTWQEFTMQTLASLQGQGKIDSAKGLKMLLRAHKLRSSAPLPDDEADPKSGYCWKMLYPIVASGGNKLNRQQQKASGRAIKIRKANGILT